METDSFIVKSYGWQELAQLYSPDVSPRIAAKRLHAWVRRNPGLQAGLINCGWKKGVRILNPTEVGIIIRYLGEP